MPRQRIERISAHSRESKERQRAFAPEAVTSPSARILVQTVEQVFERREQPDHRAARAERGQILRQVALPEFLAQPQPEDAQRQNRHVAIEAQVLARRCLSSCTHSRLSQSSLQNPMTPRPVTVQLARVEVEREDHPAGSAAERIARALELGSRMMKS